MIQFETRSTRSQKEYHSIDMDSSSTLKDFCIDRKRYWRKFIVGEEVEEEDSTATLLGRMAETLVLEPEEFDNRFYMSICPEPPKPGTNMYKFCQALYKHTMLSLNEDKVVTRKFEDIAEDAHRESGYKFDLARVMGEFNKGPRLYYQEMVESRPKGLAVVSTELRDSSQRVADKLFTSQGLVGDIINQRSSSRYKVYHQLQIEGFMIDGLKMKCMIDKLVVDLQEKTIQIYDLKCVWDVEGFYSSYYLKRRAYIQGFVYMTAIQSEHCTTSIPIEEDICDFKVLPPAFLVADSANFYDPLIYQMTEQDVIDAYEGFTYKDRKYEGVKDIIPALLWAKEMDIFTLSSENNTKGGILTIQDCKNQL